MNLRRSHLFVTILREGEAYNLLVRYLIIILLAQVGCQSSSIERVCEPGKQTGCAVDEHCSLSQEGRPTCLTLPESAVEVGAPCSSSTECTGGAGCVTQFGQSRCLLFCSTEDEASLSDKYCSEHLGIGSQCLFSLATREEIGLCTKPCSVDRSESIQHCSGSDRCAIPLGGSFAMCMKSGPLEEEMSCGYSLYCQDNLSCINEGVVSRCKRLWLSDQSCNQGEIERLVRGARDPVTGKAYLSCWSDIALQTTLLVGVHYRLVLMPQSGSELRARCQSLVGSAQQVTYSQLENSSNLVKEDLLNEISSFLMEATLNVSGVWMTSNRELEANKCERFDLISKSIEPTPCELELPTLCAYLSPTL